MICRPKIHRLLLRLSAGILLNTLAGLVKRKNGCVSVGINGLLKFAKGLIRGEGVQDAREKSLRWERMI
jgi:hypothetical protein